MNLSNTYIILIVLLPLIGFLINGVVALLQSRGKEFIHKHMISIIACLGPCVAFLLSLIVFVNLFNNAQSKLVIPLFDWIVLQDFAVSFSFMIDHLTSIMLLFVTGVGSLIHIYSIGYMQKDSAYARYMSFLNLFLFFMLILIMADSLPFLFIGWEGVGLCSYLLISFWFTDIEKAKAGKKAFIVNRIGDFGFLIAMFMIVATFITTNNPASEPIHFLSFSYLAQNVNQLIPTITIITLCLFFGATGKSAQIPLYTWLPDAMAGPTPVSALIHAATMVTAGIYMIARLHFLFILSPLTMEVISTIGLVTAFLAALIALTQYDIKKILAYSTISQLGYMFLALGVGAFSGSIFHVFTHAFFKAGLFLCAGSVIYALHHEQDIRFMGGLWKKLPITAITFLIFTLAIAGIPPLSGFFSKDEILYMTYAFAPNKGFYTLAVFTAGLTAFYMMRLFVYTFLGSPRHSKDLQPKESPFVMTLPLIILAVFASITGFLGLPHFLGHNWFSEWLHQLEQQTPLQLNGPLQEIHLMMISSLWAIFCAGVAYKLYSKNLYFAQGIKNSFKTIYDFTYNKFYIDELYHAFIIAPIKSISEKFLNTVIDTKIIDGLFVNGTAYMARFFAKSLSMMQTGLISHYAFYLLIGVWLVLIVIVLT